MKIMWLIAKVPHETTLCVFIPIKRNSDRAATIMKTYKNEISCPYQEMSQQCEHSAVLIIIELLLSVL